MLYKYCMQYNVYYSVYSKVLQPLVQVCTNFPDNSYKIKTMNSEATVRRSL